MDASAPTPRPPRVPVTVIAGGDLPTGAGAVKCGESGSDEIFDWEGAGLSQHLDRGPLSEELAVDKGAVPEAPLPGTLDEAAIDAVAERVRSGTASSEDLAALGKLV